MKREREGENWLASIRDAVLMMIILNVITKCKLLCVCNDYEIILKWVGSNIHVGVMILRGCISVKLNWKQYLLHFILQPNLTWKVEIKDNRKSLIACATPAYDLSLYWIFNSSPCTKNGSSQWFSTSQWQRDLRGFDVVRNRTYLQHMQSEQYVYNLHQRWKRSRRFVGWQAVGAWISHWYRRLCGVQWTCRYDFDLNSK